MKSDSLSLIKNRLFPKFIQEEYPKLVDFIGAFLEWLSNEGNTYYNLENLYSFTDIDEAVDTYMDLLRKEYIDEFPEQVKVSKVKELIHTSLLLYQAKGTESAFDLYFKLVYGSSAEVSYPWENVLIASGGKWHHDYYIQLSGVDDSNKATALCGFDVCNSDESKTAITDYVKQFPINGQYIWGIVLSDRIGTFENGEKVYIKDKEYTVVSQGTVPDVNGTTNDGYWEGTYGMLSSSGRVLQDSNVYQKYSYTLTTTENISEWGKTVSKLIHPAGMKMLSNIGSSSDIESTEDSIFVPVLNDTAHLYVIDDVDTYFAKWHKEWKNWFLTFGNKADNTLDTFYGVTDYVPTKKFDHTYIDHDVYAWHTNDKNPEHINENFMVDDRSDSPLSNILANEFNSKYLFFNSDGLCINYQLGINTLEECNKFFTTQNENLTIWKLDSVYPVQKVKLSNKKYTFIEEEDVPALDKMIAISSKNHKLLYSSNFKILSNKKTIQYTGSTSENYIYFYRVRDINFIKLNILSTETYQYTMFPIKNINSNNILVFKSDGTLYTNISFGTSTFKFNDSGEYTFVKLSEDSIYKPYTMKNNNPTSNNINLNYYSTTKYNNCMMPFVAYNNDHIHVYHK